MAIKLFFDEHIKNVLSKKIGQGFDSIIASLAIEYSMALIEYILSNQKVNLDDFCIIVGNINGNILMTKTFGNNINWKKMYNVIAKNRFNQTVKTRKPVALSDNEKHCGSYIDGEIIIVCASDYPFFDEAVSRIITSMARLLLTTHKCTQKF